MRATYYRRGALQGRQPCSNRRGAHSRAAREVLPRGNLQIEGFFRQIFAGPGNPPRPHFLTMTALLLVEYIGNLRNLVALPFPTILPGSTSSIRQREIKYKYSVVRCGADGCRSGRHDGGSGTNGGGRTRERIGRPTGDQT